MPRQAVHEAHGPGVSEEASQPMESEGTTMSAGRLVLLALCDPSFAAVSRDALFHAPEFQLTGIIDPTIDRKFIRWGAYADILLIAADELLSLWRSGSNAS